MILHDDSLNRTTNGKGLMHEHPWEALRQLDAGSWFGAPYAGEPLPLLSDLLDLAAGGLKLNIEIKSRSVRGDGIEDEIAQQLAERGLIEQTIISSFNPLSLQRMQRANPEIACALLYSLNLPKRDELASLLKRLKLRALHPEWTMVNGEYLAWAHEAGFLVNVWTVNTPEDLQKMVSLGVDGIITNHPGRLHNLLKGGQNG